MYGRIGGNGFLYHVAIFESSDHKFREQVLCFEAVNPHGILALQGTDFMFYNN